MDCRFKELRIQRGITQEEFRQDFNLRYNRNYTPSAISLFENNKRIPEISALIDFADYFSVSLDYLLRREPPGTASSHSPAQRFSRPEYSHLKKYRALSDAGKEIVDGTLDVVYRQEHATSPKNKSYEKRANS